MITKQIMYSENNPCTASNCTGVIFMPEPHYHPKTEIPFYRHLVNNGSPDIRNRQPDQRAKKMSRDQPRLKSRIRFITMNCSE